MNLNLKKIAIVFTIFFILISFILYLFALNYLEQTLILLPFRYYENGLFILLFNSIESIPCDEISGQISGINYFTDPKRIENSDLWVSYITIR
jgi:hypothetical protein